MHGQHSIILILHQVTNPRYWALSLSRTSHVKSVACSSEQRDECRFNTRLLAQTCNYDANDKSMAWSRKTSWVTARSDLGSNQSPESRLSFHGEKLLDGDPWPFRKWTRIIKHLRPTRCPTTDHDKLCLNFTNTSSLTPFSLLCTQAKRLSSSY